MKKSDTNLVKGFTLIELMVLMAVVAIVISVGLPQMSVFFKGNQMVTNTNDLVAGLQLARSQAIKEGSRVSICKSTNADTAAPTCETAPAVGWEKGWLVFVEGVDTGNLIGQFTPSDGAILKVNAGVEGSNVTITVDNGQIENYVSFTSRGTPKKANGVSQSGLFKICDERGLLNASGNVIARGVEIGASGRVRAVKDATKIGACP